MDFSSLNFEDTHDVFKTGYQLCPTTTTEQQQQQDHQAAIDFFSFADASTTDFNNVSTTTQHHGIITTTSAPSSSSSSSHHHQQQQIQPQQQQPIDYTNVPQLTPDAGKFTSSSVLSGTNPEYMMSPLQISTTHGTNGLNPRPYPLDDLTGFGDDEDFLSPLESPAIAPTHTTMNTTATPTSIYDHSHLNQQNAMMNITNNNNVMNETFSPLTSPALHAVPPHQHHHFNQLSNEPSPETVLQQKLAMIERQQHQLRAAHRHLQGNPSTTTAATSSSNSSSSNSNNRNTTLVMNSSNTSSSSNSSSNSTTVTATPITTHHAPNHLNHNNIGGLGVGGTQEMLPPPSTATTTNNNNNTSTTMSMTSTSSSLSQSPALPQDGRFLAPATPSLLMKLGRGAGQPTMPNHVSPAVDNMASLPAAMLEDHSQSNKNKSTSIHKKPAPKRRKTSRSTTTAPFTSPGLVPMAHMSPRPNADPTIAALVSPAALRPMPTTAPIQSSPRALKPLISPSLQPNGKRLSAIEEQVAAAALATKSNYQNMREGKAKSLGIDFSSSFQSGVENRRSAHKAAEQKRRDTLKQSFDSLRKEITDALVEKEQEEGELESSSSGLKEQEEEEGSGQGDVKENKEEENKPLSLEELKSNKEKEVKQMSKVVLIQHSYEYILRLKAQNRRKDEELDKLKEQIQSLKQQLTEK
ncbi:hypothetical protein BDA99DRAFT_554397 [Phascolomyces articulosus]|uniref:BHLH domain-containing protein n=1 Tax=Phascolomyces articulosus TaxID=60185 RepID=A0AAD5PK39_9FUNG|nr:hypothetical protein BDA99DRAFT_554397 [Phascolomyces articulosus]